MVKHPSIQIDNWLAELKFLYAKYHTLLGIIHWSYGEELNEGKQDEQECQKKYNQFCLRI